MINELTLLDMNSAKFKVLATRQNWRKLPDLLIKEKTYLSMLPVFPVGFGMISFGVPLLATIGLMAFGAFAILGFGYAKAFHNLKSNFKSNLVDIDSKTLARVVYYQKTHQSAGMEVELANSRNMKTLIIRDGAAYVTDQVTKMKDPAIMAWKGTMDACAQAYGLVEIQKEAIKRSRQELHVNLERASAKYAHSKSVLMFYRDRFSNRTANQLEELSGVIKSTRSRYNSSARKDFREESTYGQLYLTALNDCNDYIAESLEGFKNGTTQKRVSLGK